MKPVVLVAQPVFVKAEGLFTEQPDLHIVAVPEGEAWLAESVREHDARSVIVGVQPYRGPLYEALGEVGGDAGAIIARFGVGHDSVDKDQARRHGIVVTNTPGVLDVSVAEQTMWLIGSLARHLASGHAAMKSGEWQPQTGVELRGRTLGILGFGAIGRRVATMASFGFGMRVVAADCLTCEQLEQREGKDLEEIKRTYGIDAYLSDIDAVFSESDVLSIHLPAVAATANFINADRLARMKPGALLVNTARGSVVDENALYDALSAGRLAGAALDVYQCEPYRPESADRDLRRLGNMVLTPHVGSNTAEANNRMAKAALANVVSFLEQRMEELTRVEGADSR